MKNLGKYRQAVCACMALIFLTILTCDIAAQNERVTYPTAKKVEQVDDYHGVKVADPYRWLEDAESAESKAWVEAQNKLTFGYLEKISARAHIRQRLTRLWNYQRNEFLWKEGGRYFFLKNDGLQNQPVLYTTTALDGQPRELLDPNKLSADGTVASRWFDVSRDGKLLAYGVSRSGSDWEDWCVRDIETGKDLQDCVKWVKFSLASWTADNKGFFYTGYDEPKNGRYSKANYHQKIYYHLLGTPQSQDKVIFERPDQKDWIFFRPRVTDDGRYLIIPIWKGTDTRTRLYYKDLASRESPVVPLFDDFDAAYAFIASDGPIFFVQTDLSAPRYKVIAVDVRKPERANWKTVIPESEETLLEVEAVNGNFIVSYLKDAHGQLKLFDLSGKFLRELALPGLGSVLRINGRMDDKEAFFSYESFNTPRAAYRLDMASGKISEFRKPKLPFSPGDYHTRQVFYRSKDGTRIPMFITAKKGLKLDGNNPTLLWAYGGFNNPFTPEFRVHNLAWMEMGGIYALPNIRGGGEYGQAWHQAGMKLKKQNVFDDFIAAAEWLIANRYTSKSKLAIQGESNGGLLMGAVLTQRPDLFGAVLPMTGVQDMLRFNKFTIGWAWMSEYGSPEDANEFKAIYAYSPLHNVRPGTTYPPTMVATADHDDRVVPGHSFKFAAALQAAQAGPAPILIRVETRAGHGGDRPTSKMIEEYTDLWGFLVKVLDVSVPTP